MQGGRSRVGRQPPAAAGRRARFIAAPCVVLVLGLDLAPLVAGGLALCRTQGSGCAAHPKGTCFAAPSLPARTSTSRSGLNPTDLLLQLAMLRTKAVAVESSQRVCDAQLELFLLFFFEVSRANGAAVASRRGAVSRRTRRGRLRSGNVPATCALATAQTRPCQRAKRYETAPARWCAGAGATR